MAKRSIGVKILTWIMLVGMLGMMISCFVGFAHGSTINPRPNSLGLSQIYENPMEYLFGSVVHVEAFTESTNVVFKPFGASLLDTEPILLCGTWEESLTATPETLFVLTYRRRASRKVRGAACHEVYRILQLGGTTQ